MSYVVQCTAYIVRYICIESPIERGDGKIVYFIYNLKVVFLKVEFQKRKASLNNYDTTLLNFQAYMGVAGPIVGILDPYPSCIYVQCTVYSVYIVLCTLYIVYGIVYIVHYTGMVYKQNITYSLHVHCTSYSLDICSWRALVIHHIEPMYFDILGIP